MPNETSHEVSQRSPVGEAALDDVGGHKVQVGILQHDARVLAAQLHLHRHHARLARNADARVAAREAAAWIKI